MKHSKYPFIVSILLNNRIKFLHLHTFTGVLAQLARALDWQSRGQGFDSPILHLLMKGKA